MKLLRPKILNPWLPHCLVAALLFHGQTAAQSSCSSDATQPPRVILERFISADCATCWSDVVTPKAPVHGLAVDWIVPSAKGDEATLSAVASRDALERLESLGQPAPAPTYNHRGSIDGSISGAAKPGTARATLRVARGVALGGYMGTSIELNLRGKRSKPQASVAYPLTAWLLLAEAIPAGAEGSPVQRLLVRNTLTVLWNFREQLSNSKQIGFDVRFMETRPMSLPEGSNPDNLRAIGWVQDAQGRVIASAASVCH